MYVLGLESFLMNYAVGIIVSCGDKASGLEVGCGAVLLPTTNSVSGMFHVQENGNKQSYKMLAYMFSSFYSHGLGRAWLQG